MTQVLIKNVPSTFSDVVVNLKKKLDPTNREALIETIEYLEDYLYVSEREQNDDINYVWKNVVSDLISKYN